MKKLWNGYINMRYLAFNPIEIDLNEAMNFVDCLSKFDLLDLPVIKLIKHDNRIIVKHWPYHGPKANSYGDDLWLYQIDKDGKTKFLSSGSFN